MPGPPTRSTELRSPSTIMRMRAKPAASSRAVRLGLVAALLATLYATAHFRANRRSRKLLEQDAGNSWTSEAVAAGDALSAHRRAALQALPQQHPRRKYGLDQDAINAAVLAGSERHGPVNKSGPLPAEFWDAQQRAWREAVFYDMVHRDMARPRSPEYWEADAAGELAMRPLALPFPLCHTYVNHKYKVIFIIHPKSASTATKRYMTLCRVQQTDACLSPLEDPSELQPLEEKWREYFVFTVVRNPWARAFSSWKFLRNGFMLRPGSRGRTKDGEVVTAQSPSGPTRTPCVEAGWTDFCGDPLLLGRVCMAQRHCCPGKWEEERRDHFMFYHVTDQATCLLSGDGGLAVDFVGRVEHVDEDMAAAVAMINARLPEGVPPLQLPGQVAAQNVGPQERSEADAPTQPPDNARYLPAFQGANATCFARLARFYEKDVAVMFPQLHAAEQAAQPQQATAAQVKVGGGVLGAQASRAVAAATDAR